MPARPRFYRDSPHQIFCRPSPAGACMAWRTLPAPEMKPKPRSRTGRWWFRPPCAGARIRGRVPLRHSMKVEIDRPPKKRPPKNRSPKKSRPRQSWNRVPLRADQLESPRLFRSLGHWFISSLLGQSGVRGESGHFRVRANPYPQNRLVLGVRFWGKWRAIGGKISPDILWSEPRLTDVD